jgi:hypothetical protein
MTNGTPLSGPALCTRRSPSLSCKISGLGAREVSAVPALRSLLEGQRESPHALEPLGGREPQPLVEPILREWGGKGDEALRIRDASHGRGMYDSAQRWGALPSPRKEPCSSLVWVGGLRASTLFSAW